MLHRRALCIFAVLLAVLAVTPAQATAPSDAASFVDGLVREGLTTMGNKQESQDAKTKRFHDLLESNFDMPLISHFVLGRYWNSASDQDRQQFTKLFTDYIVRSYAQRFADYSGQQIKITGSRGSGNDTAVQSQIISPNGGEPAKVDWRVRKEDQGFRIVDVDVEGVSMLITQREQFSTVMQRQGGVAGLNKVLKDKLASGDTSLAAPILPKK
ncbi:MAG TPA: ABC transporter substrate-binding protein [Stellaceae bacterium]|nr:ABC transporter substrate-binding protein [Stellaceae bacterium]